MAFQRTESEFLPSISRSGLVGSNAQNTNRIQVIEESGDASPRRSFVASGISTSREEVQMQEQVSLLKAEIEKRDQLVLRLSSLNEIESSRSFQRTSNLGETEVRSENAALKVKVESLTTEVRELSSIVQVKESTIAELRNEIEAQKQEVARNVAAVTSLRIRIGEVECHSGDVERVHSRSEFAIQALQKEAREYQDKIIDLEQRLRTQTVGREESDADAKSFELRYSDLVSKLSASLGTTSISSSTASSSSWASTADLFVARIHDMTAEMERLNAKVTTLNEGLKNSELEGKASRETIMRLAAEANRNETAVNETLNEATKTRGERDEFCRQKNALEKEIEVLHQRLNSANNALHVARQELEQYESRLSVVTADLKRAQQSSGFTDSQLENLRQQLSALLSDSYLKVEKRDEAIKARIQELMDISREKSSNIEELDVKLKEVVGQLDGQVESSQSNAARARRSEAELADLKEALKRYEEDMASREALNDGFRRERDKFYEFQDKLTEALRMESVSNDIGFDSMTTAILARIATLSKAELDRTAAQTSATYNLQRKVKTMKEQLDSKDLHLDLLRKKIAELEDKNKGKEGKTDLEKERDNNVMRTRKLQKQVEKLQVSLGEARQTITELKSQLLENSNLKISVLEKSKVMEELEKRCTDLDVVRGKQAKKIAALRHELGCTETELGENKELAQSSVTSLSAELKTTRTALEEVSKRERELLDLRQVVARMLGLDISTLAVPDYEIISRLEKLVQAHHSYAVTTKSLENALEDLEDGFRAGYEDARLLLGSRGRSRSFAPPAPSPSAAGAGTAAGASNSAGLSSSHPNGAAFQIRGAAPSPKTASSSLMRARSASPKSASFRQMDTKVY